MMNFAADAEWIAERSRALGFDLCGVVSAAVLPELEHYDDWLCRGFHGEMKYLEDARRRDPSLVLTPLRSIIVCGLNYNTEHPYSVDVAFDGMDDPGKDPSLGDPLPALARGIQSKETLRARRRSEWGTGGADFGGAPRGWISRYAWGDDYHEIMWSRLNALEAALKERFPEPFASRAYSDSGPISECALAKKAGLGWLGKNTLLLNKDLGSWLFLGVILTSLEIGPSKIAQAVAPPNLCGSCRKCLDACPTGALVEANVMDARRCISYLTIELRGSIPEEFREGIGWQVYGCDICQDVCPYNREAPVTDLQEFQPRRVDAEKSLRLPELEWLAGLTEEKFRQIFRGSSMKRTKWRGLVRNACIALGNAGLSRSNPGHFGAIAVLERLVKSPDSVVEDSAQWAVARIR